MIADYDGDIKNLLNVEFEGTLPVLATRNVVIFPGVICPVIVGRKQSLKLLKDISKERDAVFAVFCQKDPNVELPGEGDLIEYGVYEIGRASCRERV